LSEKSYELRVRIVLEEDADGDLPDHEDLGEMVEEVVWAKLKKRLKAMIVEEDALSSDLSHPRAVVKALDRISEYVTMIGARFEEGSFNDVTKKGLEKLTVGVSYLQGCMAVIMDVADRMAASHHHLEVKHLTPETLSEAPEPLLHFVAHEMGLENCAGMDKPALVEWIKAKIEEKKQSIPKPN